jgi:hypothetical protein
LDYQVLITWRHRAPDEESGAFASKAEVRSDGSPDSESGDKDPNLLSTAGEN